LKTPTLLGPLKELLFDRYVAGICVPMRRETEAGVVTDGHQSSLNGDPVFREATSIITHATIWLTMFSHQYSK
jgi:hypothetical protein